MEVLFEENRPVEIAAVEDILVSSETEGGVLGEYRGGRLAGIWPWSFSC